MVWNRHFTSLKICRLYSWKAWVHQHAEYNQLQVLANRIDVAPSIQHYLWKESQSSWMCIILLHYDRPMVQSNHAAPTWVWRGVLLPMIWLCKVSDSKQFISLVTILVKKLAQGLKDEPGSWNLWEQHVCKAIDTMYTYIIYTTHTLCICLCVCAAITF